MTEYSLDLDGIDSMGDGASDVMELVTDPVAHVETQQMLLDSFMQG